MIVTLGDMRLECDLPAEAAEMLRGVAAMCEELNALGAQVSVSVELRSREGERCSTSKSISIPIPVAMELPAPAVRGTSNGTGHLRQRQADDLLPGEQGNGGGASPAITNGSGDGTAAVTVDPPTRKIPRAELRKMDTEALTALVLGEIRRLAVDGVAPSFAAFLGASNAPVQGLLARRDCTWVDLVAEAGCAPAPRNPKQKRGGVAVTNGASFRPAAGA